MPTRDVLNFITSGRMSSLRELSIAIDYKDWVRISQFIYIRPSSSTNISPASFPSTTPANPSPPFT
jgi:hypothetical protein